VADVLSEIGAGDIPQLQVYNKLDLTERLPRIDRDSEGRPWRVWVSAVTGEGIDLLREAIIERLGEDMVDEELRLSPTQGKLRAELHRLGAVATEEFADDGGVCLNVRLPRSDWNRLMKVAPEAVH
jgi:GTP-binding protein HflX